MYSGCIGALVERYLNDAVMCGDCLFVLPARSTDGDVQRHLAGRGRRAGARLHDELHQDHDGQREAPSEHAHPATHQVLRHQGQRGRVSVQTCC